jgi:starvation-inducible outer membrane lipoprotein
MKMFINLILFIMLLTITAILLSGCSTKPNKKVPNIPFSIIKKIVIGLD